MAEKQQYPLPTNPTKAQPPSYYQAPPGPGPAHTGSTYIVQGGTGGTTFFQHSSTTSNYGQPPVVQTTVRQGPAQVTFSSGGMFDGLGKAFQAVANDLSAAADSAVHAVVNPSELLRNGSKILIQSVASGQYVKVSSDKGLLECSRDKGPVAQYVVVKPTPYPNTIKLANVGRPSSHIAIQDGYAIGYGVGGPESELIPTVHPDWSVTFEFAQSPGSHLGILPNGQVTAPGQTNKETNASHFKLFWIGVQGV